MTNECWSNIKLQCDLIRIYNFTGVYITMCRKCILLKVCYQYLLTPEVYSLPHPNPTQPIQASVVAILVRPGSASILCMIQKKNNIWMSYTPYIHFAKIRYYHKKYQIHTMYISTKWNIRNKIILVEIFFGNKIYHTKNTLWKLYCRWKNEIHVMEMIYILFCTTET